MGAMIYDGLLGHRDEVVLTDLHTDYWGALRAAQQNIYDRSLEHRWFSRDPASQRERWTWVAAASGWWSYLDVVAGCDLWSGACGSAGNRAWRGNVAGVEGDVKANRQRERTSQAHPRIPSLHRDRGEGSAAFNERQNIFAEYLPYAIVFGCAEKWARCFGDVDTEKVVARGTTEPGTTRSSSSRATCKASPVPLHTR